MALLELQNIETYYGPVMAIRGVTLEVREGQIVALLGANGAGKTTVLKTISGAMQPQKGEIRLDGASIRGKDPDAIARLGIAHVPEGREVFPFLSVEDNLRTGAYSRRDGGVAADLELIYGYFPALREKRRQQAGYLSGGFGLVLASLILMSSLFHFADIESKTDDHCFVGFPAIWNVVAFYIFAFQLSAGASAVLVLACVALTFVPFRWGHPMRTPFLKPLTLTLSALWMIAAGATLWSGFPAGFYAKAVLAVVAVYGVGITLARGLVRREG